MTVFDITKKWTILFLKDVIEAKKAAEDLSLYISRLSLLSGHGVPKVPPLLDAAGSAPAEDVPIIILNSEGKSNRHSGFSWRAAPERIEIYGESGRGLCNGIYGFLSALGISWPVPGKEVLPSRPAGNSAGFLMSQDKVYEPSRHKEHDNPAASLRRFLPAQKKVIDSILGDGKIFIEWAARHRYDAVIFPLDIFVSKNASRKLKSFAVCAAEYGITVEAGGYSLSSLVPRSRFLLHREFFRMEGGRRKKAHHFCPTNPGTIDLIGRYAGKIFRAAEGVEIFHLWPDKGAESAWCSCPSCRAFSHAEQYRIAVNAAADILAGVKPGAFITCCEKSGGSAGTVTTRPNIIKIEKLPAEKYLTENVEPVR